MADTNELILWQEFEMRKTATVVVETGIFCLVLILALVGNLLVCGAVYRNPSLRFPCNLYMISLSLSDITQAAVSMPLSIGMLATGEWPFTSGACVFMAFTMFSLADISTYTMVLMAVNRYYRIVKPAKYQNIFKKSFVVRSALLVWMFFPCCYAIVLFAFRREPTEPNPGFAACFTIIPVSVIPLAAAFFYIPYLIYFFCYYKIYKFVESHNSNIAWQTANVHDVKISKTLLITVVSFAVLWLPIQGVIVAISVKRDLFIPRWFYLISSFFVFVSSCANPFIYGFRNRTFRNEFKKILMLNRGQSVEAASG